MTKEKFASQLAKELRAAGLKINADNAEKLIVALSESMKQGLVRDRKLIISNFGSFDVLKFGAKMIKSPRGDGKDFFMPPTDVIKWHPSGKIRQRGGSKEVPEEEYRKLIGHPQEEFDPLPIFKESAVEMSPATSPNPHEVKVKFLGKSRSYLSDDNSPISKFVRSIFQLMQTFKADKLEIVPGKLHTQLLYYSGTEEKNQRTLPKDTHTVVVEKIKLLAGPANELLLFGSDRIKLSRQLTPFGDQLTIQKV